MITRFNRKELVATYSMEHQSEIRKLLEANQIRYKYKVINRNSPSPFSSSRVRTGSLGQNIQMTYEYIIWVCRQDWDKAKNIVEGAWQD